MAALLRGQRPVRRTAHPRLPARYEGAGLGPDPQPRQRLGGGHPRRDDPLRHDEDLAARREPRLRQGRRRHRGHRQLRHRRTDPHGRCGGVRPRTRRRRVALGRGAARVHGQVPPPVAAATPHRARGDRQHGRLPRLTARLRHHGRRPPRRRRLRRLHPSLSPGHALRLSHSESSAARLASRS
ncbi:hypothetical protein SGPA1_40389 [Streptomyces misionensis JCM 4497]